ncbi:glycosyltransferase family 4 protein [Thiopseudomonas alkaliphila]|uniref:Glycosyltransferase family 4 protein n=1 Tax=Thiopseudomonas alkaliphila TaxID=1697053 RepID=A0AAW7DPY8_9GAMM|nr:glycosyltransferase family 4 protein [Thiopseudomonas alkaliphila]MDM1695098.1 glycosyltransferase family 4 protein [Thiopseudomonas alkaliphila]
MSKIVFVHDAPFFTFEGKVYSSGGFPYGAWNRYLNTFDSVTVLARHGGELDALNSKFVLSSGDKVFFKLINKKNKKYFYDVLNASDGVIVRLPSRLGILAAACALKLNKPIAAEVVGCAFQGYWYHGSLKGKIYAFYSYFKTKAVISKIRFVLYVTEDYLQNKYISPENAFSISASNVDLVVDKMDMVPRKLQRSKEEFVLGVIANYSANYKGIDTAIYALSVLLQRGFKVKLQVVGSGNPKNYIKLADRLNVLNYVEFLGGMLPGKAINTWLKSVCVYLQPSLTEGLPRSLIEAMNVGCPAVATKVGGIPELLPLEMLIDKKDHKGLAKKIESILLDSEKYEQLSRDNILRAKLYSKEVLTVKRNIFFKAFLKQAINNAKE